MSFQWERWSGAQAHLVGEQRRAYAVATVRLREHVADVAALLVGNMWLALGFAMAMLVLKLWSAREVVRLLRMRESAG